MNKRTPRTPLTFLRLPPAMLPPEFLRRNDLVRRLVSAPVRGLTPAHDWDPMTDAEWSLLQPLLPGTSQGGAGRPLRDARGRLDAIFRAVTLKKADGTRAPWSAMPSEFGKADSVARLFRRWTAAGLWQRLLHLVSDAAGRPAPLLLGLRWRVCCAFRRAWRMIGLGAIVLARRLGLYSALPGPSHHLPDPDLSEIYRPVITRAVLRTAEMPWARPPRRVWAIFRGMLAFVGGHRRLRRALEPA